jgi:PKD domain
VRGTARPTARFTVTPNPARVGQPITLDASGSSDPEGPIARYEWDLDGDGSFETDNGASPTRTVSFPNESERILRLRVTDADGATSSAIETVSIIDPGAQASAAVAGQLARAQGRAARDRVRLLPFTARLNGRSLPGPRAQLQRRGARLTLRAVRGRGRMRGRLATARAVPGRPLLARLLKARWRTRIGLRLDRRTERLSATAIALTQPRRGRASACLRIRVAVRPDAAPIARFKLLGGTGAAARLRARGAGFFRLERDGSATVLGRLRVRRAGPRTLPRSCQAEALR